MGFSIYDLLKEAEGDENQDTPATDQTNSPAEAPAEGDNPDAGAENEDDFNIDADLDTDDENNPDDEGGEAAGDDFGDGDTGGGADEESEDEPVEANTDIFGTLTAEEQQMKIMELKNQYNTLHQSCDDLLEKISDLSIDEDSAVFISKITTILFNLKHYIADYLIYTFADKSFIENDIMFNRFLSIIQSITIAFEKFEKKINQDKPKDDENIQK